jgi:hypothetical protein
MVHEYKILVFWLCFETVELWSVLSQVFLKTHALACTSTFKKKKTNNRCDFFVSVVKSCGCTFVDTETN